MHRTILRRTRVNGHARPRRLKWGCCAGEGGTYTRGASRVTSAALWRSEGGGVEGSVEDLAGDGEERTARPASVGPEGVEGQGHLDAVALGKPSFGLFDHDPTVQGTLQLLRKVLLRPI